MKYTEIPFDSMIRKSYAFDEPHYLNSPDWRIIRALYKLNYVNNPSTEQIIPKRIHQIWLGGELPKAYKAYTETWSKMHPDWEYKLWTDKDVETFKFEKKEVFDYATNNGMKSDCFRYEILNKYGGLYVDTDFECIRPFDDLLNLDFFTGAGYDTQLQLYIGLIGCVPGHDIIKECIHNMRTYTGNRGSIIMNMTGVNLFTKCFLKSVRLYAKGIVAFPMDFFYPFPNNVRREDIDPYAYSTECTYAIHHWAVSWINLLKRK